MRDLQQANLLYMMVRENRATKVEGRRKEELQEVRKE
jgi:hypothetical protein